MLIAGGALRVASPPGNELRRLHLRHCTLAPIGQPSLIVEIPDVEVEIDHCILGALQVAEGSQVKIVTRSSMRRARRRWPIRGIDAARETAGGTVRIDN